MDATLWTWEGRELTEGKNKTWNYIFPMQPLVWWYVLIERWNKGSNSLWTTKYVCPVHLVIFFKVEYHYPYGKVSEDMLEATEPSLYSVISYSLELTHWDFDLVYSWNACLNFWVNFIWSQHRWVLIRKCAVTLTKVSQILPRSPFPSCSLLSLIAACHRILTAPFFLLSGNGRQQEVISTQGQTAL